MAARVLFFEETGGEGGSSAEDDQLTRRFNVKVSGFGGHVLAIRRHRADLQRYQPHPEDPKAYVDNFTWEQRGNSRWFDVTVEYTDAREEPEDPLSLPADVSWETSEITRVVTVDSKGRPIVNTAGQLLLDVQEELGIVVCRIEKNVAAVPRWFKNYANAVNSDAPRIDGFNFEPRTGLLKRWRLGKKEPPVKDVVYRKLEMEILYREDTWDRKLLNRGLYEISLRPIRDPDKPEKIKRWQADLVQCLNDKDEPVTEPQFLDASGRRPRLDAVTGKPVTDAKKPGVVKTPIDPQDVVTLTFETKKTLPFSVLPSK